MSAPLDPGDFAPRPWVPLSGWPIGRDDLEPFYRRAQRVLDLGPFDYDPEALSPDRLARLTPELLVSRVFRFSTPPTPLGEKYRDTLRLAANVTVFLNANLVDIESAGHGAPAHAFVARSLAGRHLRVAARAFVLALGGIENARLLLNADRTANGGIGNQYDLVGRYFMEHPGAMIGRMLLQQQGWEGAYVRSLHAQGTEIQQAVAPSPELQETEQILNLAAFFGEVSFERPRSKGYGALYDIKQAFQTDDAIVTEEIARHLWTVLTDLGGVAGGIWERLDPITYVTIQVEQAPNPDSRVRLIDERDPLGLRRVALDWRLSALDKRTVQVFTNALARELGRLQLARLQVEEWVTADDDDWGDYHEGANHHMGTTRMADDPKRGVVDRDCRVHGCPNLFVAGSSVFPTSGFANPTLTIVAMALRLAGHLESWLAETPLIDVGHYRDEATISVQ